MLNLIIGIIETIWGIALIGFWLVFYKTEYKKGKMEEARYKHELSFPFPDLGWVMPNLIIGGIGLVLEQKWGFFFTTLAGSGMMFLGLIDLTFGLQNDVYNREKHGFDAVVSMGIVILTFILGPLFIILGFYGLI